MTARARTYSLFATCFVLIFLSTTISAQEFHPRKTTETSDSSGDSRLSNDPIIISEASPEDISASPVLFTRPFGRFNNVLLSEIDSRLGAHYVYGAEGPNVFDCSGFVWSVFRSAGIDFERGSARTLWSRFQPVPHTEGFKFGTLVFFSGLSHIGIVADERGFFHASRHKGVVYSPFNDYWLARIDGFRRVPVPEKLAAE